MVVFNMTKIQVRKQFTTDQYLLQCFLLLFSIWRRYKFESNSQHIHRRSNFVWSCFQYDEDTSSKAIHNNIAENPVRRSVVFNMTKIQVRKQFTTVRLFTFARYALFSIWRRYKFESNSQLSSKVSRLFLRCFQYDEDTSSKAIHNTLPHVQVLFGVVFNMTKIQVRKQFTTPSNPSRTWRELFSIWRRYKFESNSQLDRCK